MQIRPRRDGDLDELVAVAGRVHAADSYPLYLPGGDLHRFLTRPRATAAWVAVGDRAVIGHVALNAATSPPVMDLVAAGDDERPPVYVARLLVDPGARRAGIGRALLDHARRAAEDLGHFPILDVVDTATAAAAIALYRREGWEEIGRVTFDLLDPPIEELVFRGPR